MRLITAQQKEEKNLARARQYSLRRFLLNHKINGFQRQILIPDDLIAELENFASRNRIAETRNPYDGICSRCLKAHALNKAKQMGLPNRSIKFLLEAFKGEAGHDGGYYFDKGKLARPYNAGN